MERDALRRSVAIFEKHHLLDVWDDRRIRLGICWEDDIKQAMTAAQLAVVLLTPQALESRFIREKESRFSSGAPAAGHTADFRLRVRAVQLEGISLVAVDPSTQ